METLEPGEERFKLPKRVHRDGLQCIVSNVSH